MTYIHKDDTPVFGGIMFFKTYKKLKAAKEIINDLLSMLDHIQDEFKTVRQGDIRYKRAKQFVEGVQE